MEIKRINETNAGDLLLANEPFPLFGRVVPSLKGGVWTAREELFPENEIGEMVFPDEGYDYEAMKDETVSLAAYEDGRCVGLAIYEKAMFRYLCLSDLKVARDARRKGVGRALIEAAKPIAKELGYRGIQAICQDNNLAAARFYFNTGFTLGGFDNKIYTGTSQEGKADLILYLDF